MYVYSGVSDGNVYIRGKDEEKTKGGGQKSEKNNTPTQVSVQQSSLYTTAVAWVYILYEYTRKTLHGLLRAKFIIRQGVLRAVFV